MRISTGCQAKLKIKITACSQGKKRFPLTHLLHFGMNKIQNWPVNGTVIIVCVVIKEKSKETVTQRYVCVSSIKLEREWKEPRKSQPSGTPIEIESLWNL